MKGLRVSGLGTVRENAANEKRGLRRMSLQLLFPGFCADLPPP